MTKLEGVFPKDTFCLMMIYALSMCMILFGISWVDFIIVMLIDAVAMLIVRPIEIYFFYKIFPEFSKVRNFDSAVGAAQDFEAQNELINCVARFPERRCLYALLGSFIKVLPAGLYLAYVSKTNISYSENLLLFYVADVFILIYGVSLLFVQLNYIASDMIAELRFRDGWKENYRDFKLNRSRDNFATIQNIVLVSMLVNLFLVASFANYHGLESKNYLFVLFSTALLCIGRIQILFQGFFRKTLRSMFEAFDKSLTTKELEILPLHTSPLVANFEYTFNQLGLKLEEREKEITQWLKHESGQFHLRALGEVTAMVAHDMKTPLHVMSMSLEMMNSENVSPENKKKYLEILERNLGQSISFSKTLMAYVRGNKEEQSCIYGDIHHYLLDLFKTQFNEADLSRIDFKISDEAAKIELKVTRMDAMHIFYNLYQNAIRTVLSDERPSITIKCQIHDEYVIIFLHNSGERLAPEMFYNLISFDRFKSDNQFYNGLGLRLTNSILTHLKGSLDIVHVEQGTCLKITLPCETNQKPNFDIDPNNSEETVQ